MNLNRILKTIFLVEFISGLYMAIKELFRKSKTINYPFEKGSISPRMRGEHALEDILMEKKDVLLVNYVKQFVLHKQLQLSLQKGLMEVEKQLDMILICLNVFIVDYVKSLVQLMLLYKVQILNLQQRLEKNFITIKKNF